MKHTCGIDIVHIPRIKKLVDKHGGPSLKNPFIKRVFSKEEIAHIIDRNNPYPGLAGRFAAKEAVIKALDPFKKIADLKSIMIKGKVPKVEHKDKELSKLDISVSISHDGDYAIALVVVTVLIKTDR